MSFFKTEEGWKWTNIVGIIILLILVIGVMTLTENEKQIPIEPKVINNYYSKNITLPYTKYQITAEDGSALVFYCPESKCQ